MLASFGYRSLSTLMLAAVCGAAGWFAGKAAHQGMQPSGRPQRQPADARVAAVAPEPPRVPADSPAANWMARAKAAASGDFGALLEEIPALFPGPESAKREAARLWLLGLWITRDAQGAHDYVAGKSRDSTLHGYFGVMLGKVAPDKVEAILQNSPLRQTHPFAAAVLRSLAETAPLTFFKMKPSENGVADRHFVRALQTLAARDPAAAAAALAEIRGRYISADRQQAVAAVVNAWMARDAAGLRAWMNGLKDKDADLHHRAQHAWLSALAKTDPAAAQRELAKMDAGWWLPEQDGRVAIVVALARTNLPAAVRELQRLTDSVKAPEPPPAAESSDPPADAADPDEEAADPFASPGPDSPPEPPDIWRAVAEAVAPGLPRDPAQLLAALRDFGKDCEMDAGRRDSLQRQLVDIRMREWNTATSLEALKLLLPDSAPPQDSLSDSLRSTLIRKLTYADPELSLQYYATLSEAGRKELSYDFISGIIDARDPALTLRMAPLVPRGLWSMSGANTLGGKLGETPEAAKAIIEALPVNGNFDDAHSDFAGEWARRDPAAAAQWVASRPEDIYSAQGLAETWAGFDDTAASAWAAGLPEGKLRDAAARGLVNAIAPLDPESAWQWASSISSRWLATEAYQSLALAWGNTAPPEFAAALTEAMRNSSPAAKAAALELLNHPPPQRHFNP